MYSEELVFGLRPPSPEFNCVVKHENADMRGGSFHYREGPQEGKRRKHALFNQVFEFGTSRLRKKVD